MKQLVLVLVMAGSLALLPARSDAVTQQVSETAPATVQRIPFKTDGALSMQEIFRIVGGLIVALGIAFATVYILKRYGAFSYQVGTGNRIRVIEARRLLPKTAVFLIEADGTRLLLGAHGDQLVLLHTYPNGETSERSVGG